MARLLYVLCSLFIFANSCDSAIDATDANSLCSNCAVDTAHVEHQEEDESCMTQVSLLQSHRSQSFQKRQPDVSGITPGEFYAYGDSGCPDSAKHLPDSWEVVGPSGTEALHRAWPLIWTHVPKCGSSFLNSLLHLPGVCPGFGSASDLSFGPPPDVLLNLCIPDWPERCPGMNPGPTGNPVDHFSVGSLFEDVYHGHGLIMLRQPEQRLISMYNDGIERKDKMRDALFEMGIVEFAKMTKGCAVRMLTRETSECSGWTGCMGFDHDLKIAPSLEVTNSDVVEAQRRLRGYAFVGITDDWSTSICLLHKMFGGHCQAQEFVNVRTNRTTEEYDTSVLEGVVDEYDGALYEEALSIYRENIQRYGVSQKSCQSCFQSAGLEM